MESEYYAGGLGARQLAGFPSVAKQPFEATNDVRALVIEVGSFRPQIMGSGEQWNRKPV